MKWAETRLHWLPSEPVRNSSICWWSVGIRKSGLFARKLAPPAVWGWNCLNRPHPW